MLAVTNNISPPSCNVCNNVQIIRYLWGVGMKVKSVLPYIPV